MARDLRRYSRNTYGGMLVGFILLLFLVGDGLIYIFLGKQAAILGLICMIGALVPVVLIAGVLFGIDWITRKYRES
jgi:hypothetical protein